MSTHTERGRITLRGLDRVTDSLRKSFHVWKKLSSQRKVNAWEEAALERADLVLRIISSLIGATRQQLFNALRVLESEPVPDCKNFEQFTLQLLKEGVSLPEILTILQRAATQIALRDADGHIHGSAESLHVSSQWFSNFSSFSSSNKSSSLPSEKQLLKFSDELVVFLLGQKQEDGTYCYSLNDLETIFKLAILRSVANLIDGDLKEAAKIIGMYPERIEKVLLPQAEKPSIHEGFKKVMSFSKE